MNIFSLLLYLGEEALNKFIDNLSDIATPDKKAILEGKNMFIILSKKTDTKKRLIFPNQSTTLIIK